MWPETAEFFPNPSIEQGKAILYRDPIYFCITLLGDQ